MDDTHFQTGGSRYSTSLKEKSRTVSPSFMGLDQLIFTSSPQEAEVIRCLSENARQRCHFQDNADQPNL